MNSKYDFDHNELPNEPNDNPAHSDAGSSDIASAELMRRAGADLSKPFERGHFPPEMRQFPPEIFVECEECDGEGSVNKPVHVYEQGCGFSHPDVEVVSCKSCDGTGGSIEEAPPDPAMGSAEWYAGPGRRVVQATPLDRQAIIDLIREKYDPVPNDWYAKDAKNWDDGTGEIADEIICRTRVPDAVAPNVVELKAADLVAKWMIARSIPTGHGDTLDDLLNEIIRTLPPSASKPVTVDEELSDDVRIPLHELQADIKSLIGRVAIDGSTSNMIADAILTKLSYLEEGLYRTLFTHICASTPALQPIYVKAWRTIVYAPSKAADAIKADLASARGAS